MSAQQTSVAAATGALAAGMAAPEFSLAASPDRRLALSDPRGRPVVLAFYPADWSPVCGDQMALYNEVLPEFDRLGAEIVGISVDGAWCQDAVDGSRPKRRRTPA